MRWAVALVVVTAACGGGSDALPPLKIQFAFDTTAAGGCPSEACSAYGMSCDAVLYVDITDPDTGERMIDAPICERVGGENACSLFAVTNTALLGLPPRTLRVSVAAWRPEVLAADPVLAASCSEEFCCPTPDMFDLQGVPLVTFVPQPAFGRAEYVDFGTADDAVTIDLACTDPGQLHDPIECTQPELQITALIDDIEGLNDRLTEDQARAVVVGVAEPRPRSDGQGNTFYVISGTDRVNLDLDEPIGAVPTFSAFTERSFDGDVCVTLLEDVSQAFTIVTCQPVVQPDPLHLDVTGHFIPVATVEEILTALGESELPGDGIVIGRVVDSTGQALPGVTVTAEAGSVQYLNATRTALIGLETSASAYFVSTNAPYGTVFTARHSDGRIQEGAVEAGLIRDKVSVVLVHMEP